MTTSARPDPTSPTQLRALFARQGFRPRRSLGQTFLVDANVVHKIVQAAEIGQGDPVVEIGAGAGAVTRALAEAAERVVAVEIDPALMAILAETVPERVACVQADVLAVDWASLLGPPGEGRWRLVANLPYAITGPALLKLLEAWPWVQRFVIMAQEEVAERLAAPPGARSRGMLSVLLEATGEVEVVRRVPRTCFHPRPKVDSAVVTLTTRRPPLVPAALQPAYRRVVQAAFSGRRKTLVNALTHAPRLSLAKSEAAAVLAAAAIGPDRRAEMLTAQEFFRLTQALLDYRPGLVA